MDKLVLVAILGLGVGVPFGYALQRGRFCLNSAFRDLYLVRDSTIFRAYVLALLIQMVGVHALAAAGWISLAGSPFWWLAAAVGGFIFGWGMALSGG